MTGESCSLCEHFLTANAGEDVTTKSVTRIAPQVKSARTSKDFGPCL
jgi:hypothetical protein